MSSRRRIVHNPIPTGSPLRDSSDSMSFWVDSMPEEVAQRYKGDAAWHSPGDLAYVSAHDAGIVGVMEVAASDGAVVFVADSPDFATGDTRWAEPASVDGSTGRSIDGMLGGPLSRSSLTAR